MHKPVSEHRNFLLLKPSPIILPANFGLLREPPRKQVEQQRDYLEKFDFRTVYYDVFEADGTIMGIGPPMRNLKAFVDDARANIDGETPVLEYLELDRMQITTFRTPAATGRVLGLDHELGNLSCEIGRDLESLFAGQHVVTTKSKNNAITWICDWARFYAANHKTTGVLLYDNGSTDYTAADILDALRGTPGLRTCVVVEWNFPWGSPGGVWAGSKSIPWDSDYCQYGAMEHARRRLLRNAASVINHDIDELLVSSDGTAACEVLFESGCAGVEYKGRWIETVGTPVAAEPRFFNFAFYDKNRAACTKKWVVNPILAKDATQWKLHGISGLTLGKTNVLSHRHFMGISNNWKHQRTKSAKYDSGKHLTDQELLPALVKAFATPIRTLQRAPRHTERLLHDDEAQCFVTTESSGYPAYWNDDNSFGAALAPWLLSMITGSKVRNTYGNSAITGAIASVGSRLNRLVNHELVIWGAGASSPFSTEDRHNFQEYRPGKVLAVRGSLTADALTALGVQVPRLIGDPTLLLPRFFHPEIRPGGIVVCAAPAHQAAVGKEESISCRVIDMQGSPADVVTTIANSSSCISTSLYGLLVAQAYGVPWTWLRIVDISIQGEEFQFEDFFTSLDRGKVAIYCAKSEELASLDFKKIAAKAQLPKPKFTFDLLLDAFPMPD